MGLSDIAMPMRGLELLRLTREQSHCNGPKLVQRGERGLIVNDQNRPRNFQAQVCRRKGLMPRVLKRALGRQASLKSANKE
jgi:hypothetical protein